MRNGSGTLSGDPAVISRTFPPHPTTARAARQFVVEALADRSDETIDAACLLTSELVTNAVIHAQTDVKVTALLSAAAVRVEVVDSSLRPPVRAVTPPEATRGRGLHLVNSVADAWGYEPGPPNKVVWFELTTPGRS